MDFEAIIQMIVQLIGQKFPILLTLTGYILASLVVVSPLIELVELVAKLTPSPKDDEAVSKVKVVAQKIIPVLEALPHVNLPVAKWLVVGAKLIRKGAAALKAWLSAE